MIRATQLLLLFLAQSTTPREIVQLARIKHDMAGILNKMPDYMCQETVERSSRQKGVAAFKEVDVLRLDVAFVGGKELFGRRNAGQIDKSHPNSFTGHGVTSNGEFTGHARTVFLDGAAAFRYAGSETLDGRAALRWNYTISSLTSGWTLLYAGRLAKVASKGSFWADPESLDLLQLDVEATEIEADFPIQATHLSIGYGRVQIGTKLILIPQRSDLLVTNADGTLDRNQVEFSRCREYGAESAISFDEEPSVKK